MYMGSNGVVRVLDAGVAVLVGAAADAGGPIAVLLKRHVLTHDGADLLVLF